MGILREEKAQGSTEFLLILSGVILVAAVIGIIIKKAVIRPLSQEVTATKPIEFNV